MTWEKFEKYSVLVVGGAFGLAILAMFIVDVVREPMILVFIGALFGTAALFTWIVTLIAEWVSKRPKLSLFISRAAFVTMLIFFCAMGYYLFRVGLEVL